MMKPKRSILILLVLLSVEPGAISGKAETNLTSKISLSALSTNAQRSNTDLHKDDLQWLVGRWRCVTRQYFVKREQLLASRGEDSLEYFNVYFPYADERQTLHLADQPEHRPIAAEFLVRYVDDTGAFSEMIAPMAPGGPVKIGKNRIWYGSQPFNNFEFSYSMEKRGHRLWLVLESKHMRLELIKLFADLGDIKDSFVSAPIKDYPAERISELRLRYNRMRAE